MVAEFFALPLGIRATAAIALLMIALALWFSIRSTEFTWPNISVLGLSLAAFLAPNIQKMTVGKDAISFEQFAKGIDVTKDVISNLSKSTEDNTRAISDIRLALEDMRRSVTTANVRQAEALAQVARQSPSVPGGSPVSSAVMSDLLKLQDEMKSSGQNTDIKLDQISGSLKSIGSNNDLVRKQIRDIDSAIKALRISQ